jgi:hypothetical protein
VVAGLMAALLAWSILSSLSVYPFSMSYFNELAGGPTRGHRYLVDASVDWGQDLFRLREWINAHPGAAPLSVDFQSAVPLEQFGIKSEQRTDPLGPGWYAISLHKLHENEQNRCFLPLEPADRIGYSMNIYYLSEEAARRADQATKAAQPAEAGR